MLEASVRGPEPPAEVIYFLARALLLLRSEESIQVNVDRPESCG